jgi:hypothetical protein
MIILGQYLHNQLIFDNNDYFVYLIAGQYIKCLVAQLLVARPSTPAMHHR